MTLLLFQLTLFRRIIQGQELVKGVAIEEIDLQVLQGSNR